MNSYVKECPSSGQAGAKITRNPAAHAVHHGPGKRVPDLVQKSGSLTQGMVNEAVSIACASGMSSSAIRIYHDPVANKS